MSAAFLTLAGVWVICQVLKGGAVDRLIGSSSGSSSGVSSAEGAAATGAGLLLPVA